MFESDLWRRIVKELQNLFPLFRYLILQTETHAFCLALACAALFGFFPASVVMLTLLRYVLHWDAAYNVLLDTLRIYFPTSQAFVLRNMVFVAQTFGRRTQLLSLAWVLLGSAGVFIPLETGFNRLWQAAEDRPYWMNQFVGVTLTLACSALALFFVAISTGLHALIVYIPLEIIRTATRFAVIRTTITCLFIVTIFALYRFVPNKKIETHQVLPAAIVAGVMAEVVRAIFSRILPYLRLTATQGPFSITVSFLLLVYFETFVVLGGAFLASRAERYPWMGFLKTKRSDSAAFMKKSSPLLPIFLIVLVDVLGLTIILPLLPFYAESLGATPAVVGLIVSTYAACQLIAGPPLGHLSDRVGRRPVLLVSQIGTCIGFLILASARVLWMVFLARIIDGLTAGNLTVAQAYISDVTEPENRAKSFGIIGIAFGLGFLVGPALSGYLAQFSKTYPILLAACLSFTSIMCTYFLLPSVIPHQEAQAEKRRVSQWKIYAESFKDGQLGPMLWQFFAFTFAFSTLFSGFALFAERRFVHNGMPFGPKEVGYVFAFSGLIGAMIQGGGMGSLVKKFGEGKLVQVGFAGMGLGFALLSGAHQISYLLVAIALLTFGSAILRPSLTSLITTRAARHRQGMVIGLMQSLMSIAQIIAPVIAGILIQKQYLSIWALAGTTFCAVGWSLIAATR